MHGVVKASSCSQTVKDRTSTALPSHHCHFLAKTSAVNVHTIKCNRPCTFKLLLGDCYTPVSTTDCSLYQYILEIICVKCINLAGISSDTMASHFLFYTISLSVKLWKLWQLHCWQKLINNNASLYRTANVNPIITSKCTFLCGNHQNEALTKNASCKTIVWPFCSLNKH